MILADFDLVLGSVDACLDIIPDNSSAGRRPELDRLDLTLLKRSLTRHSSGLYVLPHPVAMEDAAKIDPEALRRVLGLLKAAFPTVVIDTSKGLQSSDFVAFEMADVILVVVQLDLTCLRNTARLLHLFRAVRGPDRPGQAGRQPRRLARGGDQPEEGRGDAEDADLVADPQRDQAASPRRGPRACRSTSRSPPAAGAPGHR